MSGDWPVLSLSRFPARFDLEALVRALGVVRCGETHSLDKSANQWVPALPGGGEKGGVV